MEKLKYIKPDNFQEVEVEFFPNHVRIANYVERAVHLEDFFVNGPIISDDMKKLVIGVFGKELPGDPRERYKITIEKI